MILILFWLWKCHLYDTSPLNWLRHSVTSYESASVNVPCVLKKKKMHYLIVWHSNNCVYTFKQHIQMCTGTCICVLHTHLYKMNYVCCVFLSLMYHYSTTIVC